MNNIFFSQRPPTQTANMTIKCQVCILGRQPLTVKMIIYYHYSLFIQSYLQTKATDPKCNSDILLSGLHFGQTAFNCKNYYLLSLFIIHKIMIADKGRRPKMQIRHFLVRFAFLGKRPLAAKDIIYYYYYSSNNFYSQRLPTHNANLTMKYQVCIFGRWRLAAKIIG